MKNKRLLILLGGIVLSGAAFLLLNFRVAASNTKTDNLLFTTDMGDSMPVSMQRREKISIVLVGERPLVRTLQKMLTEHLDKTGREEIKLV